MAELEATIANATSTSTSSASTRLKEVGKLFGQFFELLFAIIGFAKMNTSKGKSQADINSIMMALVFMVSLYYLALVLVTMLHLHIKSFLPSKMIILLLGSVVSILALMVISPTIAWIYLGFWIFIFALMCYKSKNELYQWIPERIKKVFEGKTESGISELPVVRSLPI
ncbi:uncharacterized protein [Medicago truncatula]|nr:uncharacterized protein LOC120576829 [Medicago truncatula]